MILAISFPYQRMHLAEENISRPNNRQASITVGVGISNICCTYNNGIFLMTILHMQPTFSKRMKTTLVVRNESVPEAVRDKGIHTLSSNVNAMDTQPSHATTVSTYNQ